MSAAPMSAAPSHAASAAITLTRGERIAERVSDSIGTWLFIGAQAAFLATWFLTGGLPGIVHDPFPWLGANIIMSGEAAFSTSFVLISQKVAARHDRAQAKRMEQMLATIEALEERAMRREAATLLEVRRLRADVADLATALFILADALGHPVAA